MLTLEEIWNIARNINEEAHGYVWSIWIEADELMESDDETDWEIAEDLRCDASREQAEHFRDLYYQLDEEQQSAIIYWLKESEDFKEEFSMWFGEEEFTYEFSEDEIK